MSVLSPQGHRPATGIGGDRPTPEHRQRSVRTPGASTSSRSFDWREAADQLTGRTIAGIAAVGLAVVGLVAIVMITGGGGGQATLTAPTGDTETDAVPSADDDLLVNRSGDVDADRDPLGTVGTESDPAAGASTSADDPATAPSGEASAEADATGAANPSPSSGPSVPVRAAPPTTTPDATVASSAPPTDPPTTPPPPTTPSTTATPATEPPTTPAPTTPPTTAPSTTAAPQTQPPPPSGGSAEQQVLNLVNAERANAGCGAVSLNGQLNAAALAHSQDMSANGYFSHTGLNGSQPWDRAEAAGYSYRSIGENIAQGYGSAEAVMNGWMNSSGHRANILNCDFTEMGIGRASGNYWTQLFGRPR